MESTWEAQDLPVLTAAVKYIEDNDYNLLPQAYDLAPLVGLDADDVGKSLLRLNGVYIEALLVMGGLSQVGVKKLHPRVREAVGQWPSPEQWAESILAGLQEEVEAEPDPGRRTKLKQTAAFLGSAGKDLFINLLATAVARGTGLG